MDCPLNDEGLTVWVPKIDPSIEEVAVLKRGEEKVDKGRSEDHREALDRDQMGETLVT